MQDRLMAETIGLVDEAQLERAGREAAREREADLQERLARLTTPIGVSPHEPSRRRAKRQR